MAKTMSMRLWTDAAKLCCAATVVAGLSISSAQAQPIAADEAGARLVRAYPEALQGVENGMLVWRDGTRMPISDGRQDKTFDQMLDAPDIDDMFALPYPSGNMDAPPPNDPGRVRDITFFKKMYGDCTKGGVAKDLVEVPWLPNFGGGAVRVTRVNGVDRQLAKVSVDLAKLPPEIIKKFLIPNSGTYNCRAIARTDRLSAHGLGIAIDIATRQSDYWQWSKNGAYRNRIPKEIVQVFERYGFIWGGKWKSFDTMHFEYRPELFDQPQ